VFRKPTKNGSPLKTKMLKNNCQFRISHLPINIGKYSEASFTISEEPVVENRRKRKSEGR